MTEAQTDSPIEPSRSDRGPWTVVALVLALVIGYQGVMWGVREYVNSRIEENEGELVEFELTDLDGKVWRAADLRGRKVVLNFFRSGCQSCAIESKAVRDFAEEADPGEIVVLGIMVDEVEGFPPDVTRQTLVRFGYRHPVLMADAAFVDLFHGAGWSNVTPVTYVVGEDGRIATSLRGHQTLATLREAVAG